MTTTPHFSSHTQPQIHAPARPRLAEVERFLAAPWHDAAARERAQSVYRSWALLAEAGVVADAEGCIAEVWALHRADRLAGLKAAATQLGIPLEPLAAAEPVYREPGVYYLAWREQRPARWQRLLARLGLRQPDAVESGRFRKHALGHPSTAKLVMRLPAEVAHWAFLLGQRSEPEDLAIFEKVNDPDPILAVMVADQWFMICKWD